MTRRKTPRVDQTERNAAIVRLREQKVPYKVIAGHLGITVGAVNAVVRKCYGNFQLKRVGGSSGFGKLNLKTLPSPNTLVS
jgi:hypothetical protein